MPDYADLTSVAENENERAVLLAGDSTALLFCILGEYADKMFNWTGSDDAGGLTVSETDTVKALIAKTERALMEEIIVGQLPYNAHLFHYQNKAQSGNPIETFMNTNQFHYHYSMQNTPANHDEWSSVPIWLQPGDYHLWMNVLRNTQSGILSVLWNGVEVGENDLYSSGNYNTLLSYAVTAGDAANQISGVVTGKNASSSAYRIMITDMWLMPDTWVG